MTNEVPCLRVAVWQAASVPANVDANLEALETAAKRAASDGVDLLITPEMYVTGYNIGDDIDRLAVEQPLERVREIARAHSIGIVAGGPEILDPHWGSAEVTNAAWLIDDTGAVLARHRKIQLFGALDRAHFVPGDAPVTIASFRGLRIALLICFDVEFPESVRLAAQAGADLVAVPTAQMEPYSFVNEHVIRVRAWENSVYVAYANQYGADGDLRYVGRSVIADPFGRHLAEAGPADEELIAATVDPTTIRDARRQNPYLLEVRSVVTLPDRR